MGSVDLNRYKFDKTVESLRYFFVSEGPKGEISKAVEFTRDYEFRINNEKIEVYNISFGDWNQSERGIDDFVITDNQDTEQVLATVAAIIIDFLNNYPKAIIIAKGSTLSRTRKYQMSINKYLKQIEPVIELFGQDKDNQFTPFKPSFNYISFVARKKLK
jgi:hypothetical protein